MTHRFDDDDDEDFIYRANGRVERKRSAQTNRRRPRTSTIALTSGCMGTKSQYASKEEADRALRRESALQIAAGKKAVQRSYQCDRCFAWHLTSQPERLSV
jgi:hypothetical protein